MAMSANSQVSLTLDLITATPDVAEVAKAAVKFGYEALIGRGEGDKSGFNFVHLRRSSDDDLISDLVRLVYVQALASDRSPNQVLEHIGRDLERLHVAMASKPSDVRGIGEGD